MGNEGFLSCYSPLLPQSTCGVCSARAQQGNGAASHGSQVCHPGTPSGCPLSPPPHPQDHIVTVINYSAICKGSSPPLLIVLIGVEHNGGLHIQGVLPCHLWPSSVLRMCILLQKGEPDGTSFEKAGQSQALQ